MDLILCRNVLIYFDHETAARIAARLFDCLAAGGVLLTAGPTRSSASYAPFEVEVTRGGSRVPAPLPSRRPAVRRVPMAATDLLPPPRPPPRGLADRRDQSGRAAGLRLRPRPTWAAKRSSG